MEQSISAFVKHRGEKTEPSGEGQEDCQVALCATLLTDETSSFSFSRGARQRQPSAAEWHSFLPPTCMAGSSITAFWPLIGHLISSDPGPTLADVDHWRQGWQMDDRGGTVPVAGRCKSSPLPPNHRSHCPSFRSLACTPAENLLVQFGRTDLCLPAALTQLIPPLAYAPRSQCDDSSAPRTRGQWGERGRGRLGP